MINRAEATVYTVLHFWVDFTTIFLISNVLLGPSVGVINRGYVIIIYNLVAFAGQLPMGIFADAIGKNRILAMLGCFLACIAYPLALVFPWLSCVCAALGNGFFHIGAGADIMKMSMPNAGPAGVFVSSGALGVWLAYRLSGNLVARLCLVVMLLAVVVLMLIPRSTNKAESEKMAI